MIHYQLRHWLRPKSSFITGAPIIEPSKYGTASTFATRAPFGIGEAIVAFISAYACIHYFLILVNKIGMMPFVIYRLILGVVLLWFVYQ